MLFPFGVALALKPRSSPSDYSGSGHWPVDRTHLIKLPIARKNHLRYLCLLLFQISLLFFCELDPGGRQEELFLIQIDSNYVRAGRAHAPVRAK
jgi:hypothetical protein